jgi:crotonobetainyl-CoA:carnitine CoA-transferase CaiB-like acyl-CoA transferase
MALLDCIVALGGNQVTGYFATGRAPHRYGNAHASLVPYQVFSTDTAQDCPMRAPSSSSESCDWRQ